MKKIGTAAIAVFVVAWLSHASFGQVFTGDEARKLVAGATRVVTDTERNSISFIELDAKEFVAASGSLHWLQEALQVKPGEGYSLFKTETDQLGYTHFRYQQVYDNIPVENGVFYVHTKDGRVVSANGERYGHIAVGSVPSMTPDEAYQKALQAFPSEHLIKDDQKIAKPQLTIIPYEPVSRLAYKFDLYSWSPLKREFVYVDAHDGSIFKRVNRIHDGDATGTAITMFNGNISITTDSVSPTQYRLRESGRPVETYDLNNGTNYATAVDFTDADNDWTTTTNKDHAANDAHFGAESTYDLYFNNFGRNSYDDAGTPILSYVHYSTGFVNAFWDGTAMTYGDGDGVNYDPLTSMEIVGHEITHGVTETSSGLVYAGESGALNESFSDIFGTTIRFTYSPAYGSWFIGDQMVINGGSGSPFRNMADPNQFQCADTYGGTYWNNGDIVHYDSGVQNFWYYLLVTGGTGVNDNGDAYTINGIGLQNAIAIAYRNNNVYLTPGSTFADARAGAIQSAIDLFGSCSNEVIQTTNAWYAVGVGSVFSNAVIAGFNAPNTFYCVIPATVNFLNASLNATSYAWDFGDGGTSTAPNPSHTYNSAGNYTITLVANGTGNCTSTDTLVITSYISVTNGGGPVTANCTPGTISNCCGIGIYNFQFNTINKNSGSSAEGYRDFTCSNATTLTAGDPVAIHVSTGSTTKENVTAYIDYDNDGSFNNTNELVFSSSDKLLNHNGIVHTPTTAALNTALRMRVMDDKSANTITSSCYVSQNGQTEDYTLTFIPNMLPPVADFTGAPLTVNIGGSVQFNDLTINAPTSWLWSFPGGNPASSTLQNPSVTYNSLGMYDVQLIVSNAFGTDTMLKTDYINVVNYTYMCSTTSTTAATGLLFDSGGPNGDYQSSESCTLLVQPPCADTVILSFVSFSTEANWDYFKVYDGTTTTAPMLMNMSGSTLPPPVVCPSGNMLIVFTSDAIINGAGYEANWSTVLCLPFPPVASFVNSGNSCLGVVKFEDHSTNVPTAWSWDFGDGFTSNLEKPVHQYALSGTYPVALIACNGYGCDTVVNNIVISLTSGPAPPACTPATLNYCCNMGIINVTLNSINNTSADASEGYQDFSCNAQTNVTVGQLYTVYVTTGPVYNENVRVWIDWNNDTAFSVNELVMTSNAQLTSHLGTIAIPGTAVQNTPLRMRVGSNWSGSPVPDPCTDVTYGQFEDYSVTVLGPLPTALFSYQLMACTGTTSFFDFSTNNPTSWHWDFGDGDTSSLQFPAHTYASSAVYTVQLIACNTSGCDTFSLSLNVSVLTATINYSGVQEPGQPITFTGTSNNGLNWLWNYGDGNLGSGQSTVHTYTTGGIYIVALTVLDSSGCQVTVYDTVAISGVGIQEFAGTAAISVSPNPFFGETLISVSVSESQDVSIQVYDIMGRTVETIMQDHWLQPGHYEFRFKPSQPGVYFIRMHSGSFSLVKKVIKMN